MKESGQNPTSLKKPYRFKVVLIGDQGVGKSSIIYRYISDQFEEPHNPTIGVDFMSKNVQLDGDTVRLQVRDTAGQERFRSLIPGFLRDSNIVAIVFDLSSKKSFQSRKYWVSFVQQIKNEQASIILVGNKADLVSVRQMDNNIGKQLSQEGFPYYQISAKSGRGVEQMFQCMYMLGPDQEVLVNPDKFCKRKMQVVSKVSQETYLLLMTLLKTVYSRLQLEDCLCYNKQ